MARFTPADVRRYYDRNTAAFVSFGQGGNVGAIHRAVWGPGVTRRDEAFRYVEDRIADYIGSAAPEGHIVDLGCGVGASLCYLAERLPAITGTGVTLSPVQAEQGAARVRERGLAHRVACIEGDFCDLPAAIGPADVAYAIESFVHGPDPAAFFAECRRLIRPGGVLFICDDFVRSATPPAVAASRIERFRSGWHINTLLQARELQDAARAAGFEHRATTDLTPYLELRRPRDRVVSALVAAAGWLPAFSARLAPLQGGSALQECLARGWIGYDLVMFERATPAD
jgi:SAM-dependent methyltransferase